MVTHSTASDHESRIEADRRERMRLRLLESAAGSAIQGSDHSGGESRN